MVSPIERAFRDAAAVVRRLRVRHAQGVIQAGAVELDRGYIERWAGRHGVLGVWREIGGA